MAEENNNKISETATTFIKVMVANQSSKYYWWVTLFGFILTLLTLVITTQGQYALQTWAVVLIFSCSSILLGFSLWRWSMNRIKKKEIQTLGFKVTSENATEIAQEVIDYPSFRKYNMFNMMRTLNLFAGTGFLLYPLTILYSAASSYKLDYNSELVVTQLFIGAGLVSVSLILNFVNNNIAKKMVSTLDTTI